MAVKERSMEIGKEAQGVQAGWICWRAPYGAADFFYTPVTSRPWMFNKRFIPLFAVRNMEKSGDTEPHLRAAIRRFDGVAGNVPDAAALGLTISAQDVADALKAGAELCVKIKADKVAKAQLPVESQEERLSRITGAAIGNALADREAPQAVADEPEPTPEPKRRGRPPNSAKG